MPRWQQVRSLSRAFALVAAAVSCGQDPPAAGCPKHVRVYIHDSNQGPSVAFDRVRICAGACVVLDRDCKILEGNVVSASCTDGSVRATVAVKSFYATVTLAVLDGNNNVVHTDEEQGDMPSNTGECPSRDVEFGFDYINGGGGGTVGDGSL